MYLNQTKKTSLSALSQKFEVSKRTIMRDLDAISALGVPVYTQRGYNGGVFIEKNYKFNQSFFSPSEIESLVLAIHIVDGLGKSKSKSSLLKKLELLLPELTLEKENDFHEYVKVAPLFSSLDLECPIIKSINRGLDDEVWVLITYKNKLYNFAPLYYLIDSQGLSICGTDGKKELKLLTSEITSCIVTDREFKRESFKNFINT